MYLKILECYFKFQTALCVTVFGDLVDGTWLAFSLLFESDQFTVVPIDGGELASERFFPPAFEVLCLGEPSDPFAKVSVEVTGIVADVAHNADSCGMT